MSLFSPDVSVDNAVVLDPSSTISVSNFPATQPVSAVALPLPTGAATDATVAALTKPSDTQLVDGSAHIQPVSGTIAVSNFPATQPISGSVSVSNFPATQPVSIAASVAVTGPLTDTQLRATPVPISGTVTTSPVVSSSSTVAQVVLSANTNTTIKAANASRKQLIVYAPKSIIYVKLGVGASATSFTYVGSSANSSLEIDVWQGQVDVFSTVAQTVNVTELV